MKNIKLSGIIMWSGVNQKGNVPKRCKIPSSTPQANGQNIEISIAINTIKSI